MTLPQHPGSITQAFYLPGKKPDSGGTQLLSAKRPRCSPRKSGLLDTNCEDATSSISMAASTSICQSWASACLLGYADPEVNAAVIDRVKRGAMYAERSEEVQLAEELIRIHPWASQVRYARTGGEAR
ncbi:MAG: hypothetical protein R3C11_06080 [Planctomycetaceae bacterium]